MAVVQPQKGRLPYLVSICQHGTHDQVCTGILVYEWVVLTAAHCVATIPILSGPVVHIGATSVDGDDDEVQVHDSVQSNSRNFDSNWSWD